MNCLEVTKLVSDSQERPLSFKEKIGVRSHLLYCPHCRNFAKHCQQMSQLMKKFANEK
ncbi:MAG: zf-HC2 domain-containing protein [[Actinobacillus] rossii]|uniref:Putative zinc-finger domain-containing protein n=1 Tax=[Actinobacillus] rossii TaxID=123820 RepID=A0A380TVB4_9PAST|nr:zf-HC2 domain-containing protein [[Actinobacillus] rossii]MDD7569399.1 zf-HC2 domain-containing protein [[Actinobacillus] rossii]MDY3123410.1 zf-HC2 domain-containing protein [[Actinobacillus] rossii]MDY4506426.1 zf-HC2 domain-containing protein [[Actinobacillus] rossii]MDY5792722.1 zf-HC2 domain-containing protein [[Actinobacillus] rossii]